MLILMLWGVKFGTCIHSAMDQVQETTENQERVIVQRTRICNYGQARYKLANALLGERGYSLTENFKNTIRLLPSNYSVYHYTRFLDDWGTVSSFQLMLHCITSKVWCHFQHVVETAHVGTRDINRSSMSYLEVYEFLTQQVRSCGGRHGNTR